MRRKYGPSMFLWKSLAPVPFTLAGSSPVHLGALSAAEPALHTSSRNDFSFYLLLLHCLEHCIQTLEGIKQDATQAVVIRRRPVFSCRFFTVEDQKGLTTKSHTHNDSYLLATCQTNNCLQTKKLLTKKRLSVIAFKLS